MFGRSKSGIESLDGKLLSNYEEIVQQSVVPIVRQYRGYKLYVTGHGLGAALSTIFGFMAATESDSKIPKPVTVMSFAAPLIGDASFRSAHQLLESQGKLRHLRVSNQNDARTLGPVISLRWEFYDKASHVGRLFKHVGMNLRLHDGDSSFDLAYPKVRSGYFSSLCDEFWRGWDEQLDVQWSCIPLEIFTRRFHRLKEYNRRVLAHKPSLQSIKLNELYARPDLVGHLLSQF